MKDNKENWNIYYCDDDSGLPKNEPQETVNSEEKLPAEDIPVSKYVRIKSEYGENYDGDTEYNYGERRKTFADFWLKHKKRNLKRLFGAVMAMICVSLVAAYFVIENKLDLINYSDGINFENAEETDFADEDEELAFTPVHDVTDASSLKDWLKKWAQNDGEKMYSRNVINCLLCGVDTQEKTSGRTDAMILVSLNKKTDKITLVSFMRDSYSYMNINGKDRWYKINSAYNWGGPKTLVETIENNYKIEIDNFVTVDFDTFPKLIDALGGITVEVQPYEANYINRTTRYTIKSGDAVTLNGNEALVFARIRYSDSDGDISRTRRQRQLVTSLIEKTKTASVGRLNNLANLVLPFVQTNFRKTEILSLGTQAVMQDWMSYEMTQFTSPLLKNSEDGTQKLTGKDSYMMTGYGSKPEFVWIVDYQLDAYRIQNALYGTSNIEIHEYRESPFDFVSGNSYRAETTAVSESETTTDETETNINKDPFMEWLIGTETNESTQESESENTQPEYTLPYSSDFIPQTEAQDMVFLF